MQCEPGERDMVMLQHKFEIEHSNGKKETRTSTLCDYGDPKGYNLMARLVGVLCGVACLRVLDGPIKEKGILAPVTWELTEPLLVGLRDKWGIDMVKTHLGAFSVSIG
jgi:saccharopine dehydrogenase (NADP+, L-glutamate forming)